jgi:hypothetical protein
MTRTRVSRWAPPFGQAVRMCLRPAIAYLVFTALGSAALLGAVAWYEHGEGRDLLLFVLGLAAGMFGVVAGQIISILRARALPVFVVTTICVAFAGWMMSMSRPPGGEYVAVPMVFFCFAFPCGLLSLQHRWELLASFWPAVGWIGGVFFILNKEDRVAQWEQQKVSAWLPVPLLFLAGFLVCWLFYLASKQALRVELWQSLSGAAARRVSKKAEVTAVPRKNLLPILVVAALLFLSTAVLAPFLWRTGKGEHESTKPESEHVDEKPSRRPKLDPEALAEQLQKLARAAKNTLVNLWPLLFLFILYSPAKRAFLTSHLLAPIFPAPPSERIDNLWEYIRIAAEDGGVVPTPSDSVEQLLTRIQKAKKDSPALADAAQIYIRTRYGFTVGRGDAVTMRKKTIDAARELRKGVGPFTRIRNLWRPLS